MDVQWNLALVINFIFLAVIRGTTPLMTHYAVLALNSATLLVALKCSITTLLFLLSMIWFMYKDVQISCQITTSLREKRTYLKLVVIGILQSAIPYILAVYSLRYLPPSLLGAFMVTSPWWSIIIQRLPFIRVSVRIPGRTKIGMALGAIGIICMFTPTVRQSRYCQSPAYQNTTSLNTTAYIMEESHGKYHKKFDTCLTTTEIFTGFIALFLAPVLWGSATVYWKIYRRDIHYLLSSVGQNFVGFVICIALWGITTGIQETDLPRWQDGRGLAGLLFLGIFTGWLATLLVNYLFVSIGAHTTNQVLSLIPFIAFIEDVAFVDDVIKNSPWIIALQILGVLLVTIGVFISNLKFREMARSYTGLEQVPRQDRNNTSSSRRRGRRNSLEDPLLDNEVSATSDTDSLSAMVDQQYVPPLFDDLSPLPNTDNELPTSSNKDPVLPSPSNIPSSPSSVDAELPPTSFNTDIDNRLLDDEQEIDTSTPAELKITTDNNAESST